MASPTTAVSRPSPRDLPLKNRVRALVSSSKVMGAFRLLQTKLQLVLPQNSAGILISDEGPIFDHLFSPSVEGEAMVRVLEEPDPKPRVGALGPDELQVSDRSCLLFLHTPAGWVCIARTETPHKGDSDGDSAWWKDMTRSPTDGWREQHLFPLVLVVRALPPLLTLVIMGFKGSQASRGILLAR
eukprot:g36473.t1